ncbi:helix-turn-helix domain-containing protein [Microbacterium deminutum]|uniref:TetR/AcrR family transcriptional regulator n=1 Tax=Microbacterium deminutum TaxID=344164 RepID=A0ABN2R1Y0_9MICO
MTAKTRQRMMPEHRRAQLIAEATRLISEVGFRQFTIAELARACGITRAGVLHHFASKEELLLAVLSARDLNDAEAVMADIDIHRGDVRRMLDLIVRRNMSQPEIIRLYAVLSAEALDADHPAHRYFIDRWERTIGWLAATLEGLGRPGRDVAVEVHSFMDGLQLNWLRDPAIDFTGQWAAFADDLFAHHPGHTADLRRIREELRIALPTLV